MNKRTMCAALLLLAVPMSGAAQQPGGWALTGSVGQAWFSKAAVGESTNFGPSSGLAISLGVSRRIGAWEASLAGENTPSVLRASDSVSAVEISALSFGRTGVVLSLGRTLTRSGSTSVVAGGGLRMDGWALPEEEQRWRAGAEAHAALRFAAGPIGIENRLSVGMSGSPFESVDLPDGYRRHTLRWIKVGVGARIGL